MRYRVQLRVREDTGEVELFRVDTVGADLRAEGHNAAHDQVTAEVAGVLETDAEIDEVYPVATPRPVAEHQPRRETAAERQPLPPETHGA